MADRITAEKRSWNMSRIKSRDTKPEIRVRSMLHKLGYRFRLNKKNLPGSPDIVLKKYNLVIFVHGCFWHRHTGCRYAYKPKSRIEFWEKKFAQNKERDNRNRIHLQKIGWRVECIWECETKDDEQLAMRIKEIFFELKESK